MKKEKILRVIQLMGLVFFLVKAAQGKVLTVNAEVWLETVIDGVEWCYEVDTEDCAKVKLKDPRDCNTYLAIPEHIGSYTVTKIADGAFCGAESLQHIYIPGTIESIGNAAFEACPVITTIYFGGGADAWDRLKLYTGSKNEELYNAWQYYFMEVPSITTAVTTTAEQTIISVSSALPECYDRYYDEWDRFGELSYQWYYSKTGDYEDGVLIEGATEQSYTLERYGGNYYFFCKITNEYDMVTSDTYSGLRLVTIDPLQMYWFVDEDMIDKYGNTGTIGNPYTIKNTSDFDDFINCLYRSSMVDNGLDFYGRYITVELEGEEKIDLSLCQYEKEILNFRGTMDANNCVITGLLVGSNEKPVTLEEMGSLENFFQSIHNVEYENTYIYMEDVDSMMEWFNWYYGIAAEDLMNKHVTFSELEVRLAE